jgi:hypothetical protein
MTVDASWYVPNIVIGRDLLTPTVKEEMRHYSTHYSSHYSTHYSSHYSARLSVHPNDE